MFRGQAYIDRVMLEPERLDQAIDCMYAWLCGWIACPTIFDCLADSDEDDEEVFELCLSCFPAMPTYDCGCSLVETTAITQATLISLGYEILTKLVALQLQRDNKNRNCR